MIEPHPNIAFVQYMTPNLPTNMVGDYQMDMLYHGLVSLYGQERIHPLIMPWWMYKSAKDRPDFQQINGKGFTTYATLDSGAIDLCDPTKLQNKEYDIVVIGLHHSSIQNYDKQKLTELEKLILWLRNFYHPRQIAIIDGWDRPYLDRDIAKLGMYFKRELDDQNDDIANPISFAFPAEKLTRTSPIQGKIKYDIAPLIPVNQSIDPSYMKTYIYETEEDYYNMYRDSVFALTSKKGGWDTVRHYEIIANHSIPIFVDIDNCPESTLFRFPKELCKKVKQFDFLHLNLTNGQEWKSGTVLDNCACINVDSPGYVKRPATLELVNAINDIHDDFLNWIYTEGTTLSLAKYVVHTCMNHEIEPLYDKGRKCLTLQK